MKILKLTFILICSLLFVNSNLQAQTPPEGINYQAVVRNLAGNPLVNQAVDVRFTIHQSSGIGVAVFQETHTTNTNPFGLINLVLGSINNAAFSTINWGLGTYFLQIEVNDGTGFQDLGATQLLSVPYALHAKTATSGVPGADGHNSLISSTVEPAGTNCINGGYFIQTWLDLDDDGTLSTGETPISYYVCNGVAGTNGTNGLPGTNGVDGISIDSTINNNDGTFTFYYSNSTSFTTSDLTGPAGTSGTTYFAGNGISLSGDTITNLGDLDNNSTNELQILSISNDTIFLSNGGFAPLPSAGGFWTQLGGSIHNNNPGNVGIGTTTPLHKLSVASNDSVVASFFGTNPNVSAILVANVNANAATGIVFFNGVDTTSYIFLTPTNNALTIRNSSLNGNIFISTDSIIVNQGLILVNQAQNSIYNQTDTIYNYSPSGTIVNVNQGMFLTDSLYVLGNNAANTNWVLANDGLGQAKWTDPSTIVGSVGDNWGTQTVNVDNTTIFGDGDGTPLSGFDGQYSSLTGAPTNVSAFANDVPYLTTFTEVDADTTNELQTLSFTSPNLSISGGNTVDLSTLSGTTYTAGTGINLTSDTITNTAPDQTVTINTTGAASVSGSYPNFTIAANANDTSATNEIQTLSLIGDTLSISGGNNVNLSTLSGTTYTAGTGINLTSDTITNTAPDQTVTINTTGAASVSGSYPNFTIAANANDTSATNEIQTLSLIGDTLSISSGNSVNLSTLSGTTYTAGTGINLTGDSITNTAPDQTVVITGAGTTNVTSAYPSFIVTTTDNDTSATNELQNLSVTTTPGVVTLGISGGNTINFSVDDSPTNELITSFGVNGTNDSLVIKEAGNDWAVPLTSLSSAGKWTQVGDSLFPTTLTNKVGIGTTSPKTKLHVMDSRPEVLLETIAGGNFKIGFRYKTPLAEWSIGQGEATGQQFRVSDIQTGTVPFVIEQGSGNVGIGTTIPLANLHVEGFNSFLRLQSTQNTSAANSMIEFGNTIAGTFDSKGSIGNPGSGDHMEYNASTFHRFTTNGNERMRITNTGELGIGTFAPEAKTHIIVPNGLSKALQLGNPNQPTAEWVFDVDASGYLNIINENYGTPKNVISADNTGNVGIGIPLPTDILHVGGNIFGQYIKNENYGSGNPTGYRLTTPDRDWLFLQNLGGTPVGSLTIYDGTAGANRFHISTTGDVGVGVIPTAKLHIGGVSGVDGIRFPDGTLQTTAAVGGSGWALTGNAGTNATTNFIGTTDNVALNFRVNNAPAGKIDSLRANSFFGFLAGANTSGTGAQNTAIGFQSLNTNTTGGYNTALGYRSLRNNATGVENTAIGADALQQNTGNWNTAIGYTALRDNTTGNNNTATGLAAMATNTTGSFNTANGWYALFSNTLGNKNTAYGMQALYSNTSGSWNTAIGEGTLSNNDAGSEGVAIGYQSQYYVNNTTTAWTNTNTSVGMLALRGSGTSSANTGLDNTAIGHRSMLNNTTGGGNTAIGMNSLYTNSTGSNNTTNGHRSLYSNTSGNANTAIGTFALFSNTIGVQNTANGYNSLGLNTQGNYNTAYGFEAGITNTTGSNNTLIGMSADVATNNLTNATAVGYNAKVAQSNSLVLGGTGVNAVNVGIGTTAPTATLDVVNSTLNNTAKFANTFTSGAQKVAVDGSATGGGAAANMGGSFAATGSTLSNYGIYANAYGNSGTKTGINASATGAGSNIAGQFSASGGSANYALIVPSGGGNVGIGTSTPTATLDVNGTQAFNKSSQNLGANGQINPNISSYVEVTGAGGTYTLTTPSIANGTTIGQLLYIVSNHGGTTIIVNSATVKLNGGANYSLGAYDTVTLMWSGTLWVEMGRSNN